MIKETLTGMLKMIKETLTDESFWLLASIWFGSMIVAIAFYFAMGWG